jgi:hypothetical protein
VCRGSYIHPRVLAEFTTGALAASLAKAAKPVLAKLPPAEVATLGIGALRAIEPMVARYLARATRAARA